jgi:hypothetical protein
VSAIEVILVAIAAWTTLSVAIVLMMRPLLHVASLGELAPAGPRPEAPQPEREPFSLLRESGYLGIVLERLVLHASTTFGADQVCVFGRDTRAGHDGLVLVQGAGVNPDLIGRPLDVDWDPLVAALACGRPLAVPGRLWPAWDAGHAPAGDVLSAAIAPIWFGGRVQGAVSLTRSRESDGFDVHAVSRLGELAELAGQALAHTVARQLSAGDPQREIDGLIDALTRAAPDPGAPGSEVAWVARGLARELGLGTADLVELELAARLHAVGQVRMPPGLGRGASGLTESERELLRLEPLWGAEIVGRIPGLEAVALIVRHSRERWDGLGYPDGLAGEAIPLASRIVAISEAVWSLSPRELEELSAMRFDPELAARVAGAATAVGT